MIEELFQGVPGAAGGSRGVDELQSEQGHVKGGGHGVRGLDFGDRGQKGL